jgi:hypothetical protein
MGAAAALTAGPFLAACTPASTAAPTPTATLPPPETTSIRLTAGACDSAIFAADKYLRARKVSPTANTDDLLKAVDLKI